eukprot:gene21365-28304_t
MFANAAIVLMWKTASEPAEEAKVLHITSGDENPLTYGVWAEAITDHFIHHPVSRGQSPKEPFFWTSDVAMYEERLRAQWGNRGGIAKMQMQQLLDFSRIYQPFTFKEPIYSNRNIRALYKDLNLNEQAAFNMDVNAIEWRHYLTHIHANGLRTYALGGRW